MKLVMACQALWYRLTKLVDSATCKDCELITRECMSTQLSLADFDFGVRRWKKKVTTGKRLGINNWGNLPFLFIFTEFFQQITLIMVVFGSQVIINTNFN